MSKLFFDHLIIMEEIHMHIDNVAESNAEKEELWQLFDEIINTRIFSLILDHLPNEFHEEFIDRFHKRPHDERHIYWINERTHRDIEGAIREEIKMLEREILGEIKNG